MSRRVAGIKSLGKVQACFILISFGALFFQGCVGMNFQSVPLTFEDPLIKLQVRETTPNESELKGILLRKKVPAGGRLIYQINNVLFARIRDQQGIRLDFNMKRVETFSPGSMPGAAAFNAETEFDKKGGHLSEAMEIDERGAILKFTSGTHHSEVGKFRIANWTREPLFPLEAVTVGSQWNYHETMDIHLESFWIKEVDPSPVKIEAKSTLSGFAYVGNRRTAVVRTISKQQKRYHFKVLFKKIEFDINTDIEDISYWDYEKGVLVAAITRTRSWTKGINLPLDDYGESQSITALDPAITAS